MDENREAATPAGEQVMTVKDARLAVDREIERITGRQDSVLSGLVIDLIREVRRELRLHDYGTDYSARNNLSIGDSVYRSME